MIARNFRKLKTFIKKFFKVLLITFLGLFSIGICVGLYFANEAKKNSKINYLEKVNILVDPIDKVEEIYG